MNRFACTPGLHWEAKNGRPERGRGEDSNPHGFPHHPLKPMAHTDFKTTMIYVPLGKNRIWKPVKKLNEIPIPLGQ